MRGYPRPTCTFLPRVSNWSPAVGHCLLLGSSRMPSIGRGPSVEAGGRGRAALETCAQERGRGLRAALSSAGFEARHELDGVSGKAAVPGTVAGCFPGSVAPRIRLSVPPAQTDGPFTGYRSAGQPFQPTKTARPNLALEPTSYGRPRPAATGQSLLLSLRRRPRPAVAVGSALR